MGTHACYAPIHPCAHVCISVSPTSPTSSTMKAVHRGSASKAARSPRLSEATEWNQALGPRPWAEVGGSPRLRIASAIACASACTCREVRLPRSRPM